MGSFASLDDLTQVSWYLEKTRFSIIKFGDLDLTISRATVIWEDEVQLRKRPHPIGCLMVRKSVPHFLD